MGREDLAYAFEERDGRLFLFQATYTMYDENETRVKRREIYYFQPNGYVRIMEGNPGQRPSVRDKTTDVTRNWSDLPNFNDVVALARRER
jgi:hypothetical protein